MCHVACMRCAECCDVSCVEHDNDKVQHILDAVAHMSRATPFLLWACADARKSEPKVESLSGT